MGGDHGPQPCIDAAKRFLSDHPDTSIILVGNIQDCQTFSHERLECLPANDVVDMEDIPSHALRHKRQSSMWLSLEQVASDKADACVSAGNTGALMAMALHQIKRIEGIKRPAICKAIPTRKDLCHLLDLGANLECTAQHLVQFSLMGAALAKLSGRERPRVALLNVGSESTKGHAILKEAGEVLKQAEDMDFVGFVEGDDLFRGDVDVIACDGFAGNVALKVSEGLVRFLMDSLHDFLKGSFSGRLLYSVAGRLLRRWSKKYNPSLYNGAAFLGLQKTVVKSHGSADELAFYKALEAAREQVRNQIPQRIEHSLRALGATIITEEKNHG